MSGLTLAAAALAWSDICRLARDFVAAKDDPNLTTRAKRKFQTSTTRTLLCDILHLNGGTLSDLPVAYDGIPLDRIDARTTELARLYAEWAMKE